MTIENRKRPRGQAYGRMLNHGMDPSDFLKLIERTEYNYRENKMVEEKRVQIFWGEW